MHHSDAGSQYLSIRYTERLAEVGVEPSVGSIGDSYDNALAETIIGLYNTEFIHRRGPWRNLEAVEYATLEWVDWFNHRRPLEPIGNVPLVELEASYYTINESVADSGLTQTRSSLEKPGRFNCVLGATADLAQPRPGCSALIWRRVRDSNPRWVAPQRFSRPPH